MLANQLSQYFVISLHRRFTFLHVQVFNMDYEGCKYGLGYHKRGS
uniref:Uncharacterized protein n=1 Tax=Rhizophora mucronata TaxID=61149 RepID=A0A2P2MPP0_RHIMU